MVKTSINNVFNQSAAQPTPQVTLLASIAPNLNTKVAVDTSKTIDANKAGASVQVQPQRAALTTVKQDVVNTKATAIQQIKTAQSEIMAASKAVGVQPDKAFPDTKMAPDSLPEMALDALSAKGGGSLATSMFKGANNVSLAGDIAAGMKDRPAEEVIQAIQDTLIANSQSSQDEQAFGQVVNAGDSPEMEALSIDWETVLEQHPDALEKIMYFDEGNLEAWPELAELDAAEKQIDNKLEELGAVQENAIDRHADQAFIDSTTLVGASLTDDVSGLKAKDPIVVSPELAAKAGAKFDSDGPSTQQDLENELVKSGATYTASTGMM